MSRHTVLYDILLFSLLLSGCGGAPRGAALLGRVDSLIAERPAVALSLIDSCLNSNRPRSNSTVMKLRLRRLNAINKLDTTLTVNHISEAKALVDYFDEEGTPSEKLLSFYLLGRSYADIGDSPRAIQCYSDAIASVDTSAVECDFRQLCFVYTQMAKVLYQQNLYRDELSCLGRAVYYGYKSGDTLAAISAYAQKAGAYKMMHRPDSVLIVCETAARLFREGGFAQQSAAMMAFPVRYLIERGDTAKARLFMDIYEHQSGLFDSARNIEAGREVYYYTKGTYFLVKDQYDSAEYYFRKELARGCDFNNQNAGSMGLALLYQRLDVPDSCAKYALYSYAMNDSAFDHEAMSEVARNKALYDYREYEHEALREKRRADRHSRWLTAMIVSLALILLVVVLLCRLYWRTKERERRRKLLCDSLKSNLDLARAELSALQQLQHTNLLDDVIERKQGDITTLVATISSMEGSRDVVDVKAEESRLLDDKNYQELRRKTDSGKYLNDKDWTSVENLLSERLPEFSRFIHARKPMLNPHEYQVCLLRRLFIRPRSISFAVNKDPADITHYRQSLLLKLFGMSGSSKDFDRMLWRIGKIVVDDEAKASVTD